MYWSWSTSARYRSFAVMRWRSKSENGCVPAEPTRMSRSRATSPTYPRRGRPHSAEDLAVGAADRFPVCGVDEVDARPDDVLGRSADLGEGGDDDLEAARRLCVRIGRFAPDGRGPGHVDVAARAHGARV